MSKALSPEQVQKELSSLSGWKYENDAFIKEFSFDNFIQALAFIVKIGFEAESAVHHPEIKNVYNRVEIRLTTHDAGNKVTSKDAELANRIEQLAK